jgi:fermentation-respiration switch protein FrsA (DUF1100 family)
MWFFSLSALWKALCYIGVLLVSMMLWTLYYYQNDLIYPANLPEGSRTVVMKPDEFDMPHYESVTFVTRDGVKITGYFIRQETAEATRSATTLLYLHANAGNMGHRLPIAKVLYRLLKCNIFMLSYRGYGLSEGKPSELGLRIDAQEALDYLNQHPDVDASKIVLYGQSIGGAVALDLASRNPEKILAVIVENTFVNLRALIPKVMPYLRPLVFLCHEKWESDKALKKITCPMLFLSGLQDEIVPAAMMQELFDMCVSKQKKLMTFANGTHNDTCIQQDYFIAIVTFWREHIDATL